MVVLIQMRLIIDENAVQDDGSCEYGCAEEGFESITMIIPETEKTLVHINMKLHGILKMLKETSFFLLEPDGNKEHMILTILV